MASLSVRCGAINNSSIHHSRHRLAADRPNSNPNRIAPFNRSSLRRGPRITATMAATDYPVSTSRSVNQGSNNGALFSGNLDEWMRDSAAEIVKNLREAPLFVHVYANNNGEATRLETEKTVSEEWPVVTRRWKDGETPLPDGLIFVDELGGEEEDLEEEKGTRAWGVVVQGKGVEFGPACYLLKTSRVGSGLGLCSTHFCLMKVQGFRESALSQLTNCCLLE